MSVHGALFLLCVCRFYIFKPWLRGTWYGCQVESERGRWGYSTGFTYCYLYREGKKKCAVTKPSCIIVTLHRLPFCYNLYLTLFCEYFAVLGWAIILEIVMMILLGGALLLFICKCMTALHGERTERGNNSKLLREEHLDNQTVRMLLRLSFY